jgi:hypothetical protein
LPRMPVVPSKSSSTIKTTTAQRSSMAFCAL